MMRKSISRTLQSKSGLILFAILAVYNLLLSIYLKDLLVLSPMLLTEYPMRTAPFGTPGIVCTMTVFGGTWM